MTLVLKPKEIYSKRLSEGRLGMLEIAEGWTTKPLGELIELLNGAPFDSNLFNRVGKGKPLIRIRDVGKDDTETWFSGDFDEKYVVTSGDVLVGLDGDFRVAEWHGSDALLNQRVCKLVPREDLLDKRFMVYHLAGWLDAIWEETSATTVKHLSSKTIQEIPFPLPPIEEQKRIVEALDDHLSRLDKALAEVTATENHLIVLERSILQSLLGEGARDLEMVDFDEFFRVVQPRFEGYKQKDYQSHGALPIIDQGADLVGGYTDDTSRRNKVEQPLIVFGDHTRCVKYVDFDFALGADGTKMLEAKLGIDPRFAYWQLKSKKLRNRGYARHMGELRKVRFWIPSPEDQRAITARIESSFEFVRNVRDAISAQVRSVNTLRRSLLHMAFTGKLKGLVLDE